MKTVLACILAVWLAVSAVLIGSGLHAPWSAISPGLPFILLISIISPEAHIPLRFAVFLGVLEAFLFPSLGALIIPVYAILAVAVGPLFRLSFSLPTIASLLATTLVGSLLYQILLFAVSAKMYYEMSFPSFGTYAAGVGVNILFTALVMLSGGEIYRRVFLRMKRAFI